MIEINRHPSRRDLLLFGLFFALFFAAVGTILLVRFGAPRAAGVVWTAAAAITLVHYAVPAVRRPLYLGWSYAGFPLGWLVSHLILAGVYYLLITPLGLLMRAAGRDALHRRFDRGAASYWIEHRAETDPSRSFRQF